MLLLSLLTPILAVAPGRQYSLGTKRISEKTLRLASYNVRYDSQPDSISVEESLNAFPRGLPTEPPYYTNTTEQPWSLRRLYIAQDLLFNDVDLCGGQELLKRQVSDLAYVLGSDYHWIGVGRNDGKEAGEYAAIFFNKNSVTLNRWDTFWLSDTPFEPSKYPGAGSYRVATTAHFTTAHGKRQNFTLVNTHLDDQSAAQRALGLSLVLRRAKYEAIMTRNPVFVTGDFNSPPSDEAYQIITGAKPPVAVNQTFLDRYSWSPGQETGYENFSMLDLLGQVEPRYRVGGNFATFTGFQPVGNTSDFSRIDYVMADSIGDWQVVNYRVEHNLDDCGVYHSDHRPVFADLQL